MFLSLVARNDVLFLFKVNFRSFKPNMIFIYLKLTLIGHAGKTLFPQFNRFPGVTLYLLGCYPIEMPISLTMLTIKSGFCFPFFNPETFAGRELNRNVGFN